MPLTPIIVEGDLPITGAPPASPVNIDPNVDYEYVIPVRKETSISFAALAGFTASLAGRVLTLRYTGVIPSTSADFTFVITCANAAGSTQHRATFRVRGGQNLAISQFFTAACINGSKDIRYRTDDTHPANSQPINGRIKIGDKLKVSTLTHGSAVTGIDAQTVFVVRVDDAAGRFRVSATDGGAEIEADADATYAWIYPTARNGSSKIHVGDTIGLYAVGEPIELTYSDGVAMPAAITGVKYVREIFDFYISLADTPGGAAVNSGADSFATDPNVILYADLTAGRRYASIDSDAEIAVEEEVAIDDYVVTSDRDGETPEPTYAVEGLPSGLSFNAATNTISGSPFNLAVQTRVKIIAYIGSFSTARYLLINRAGGASDLDPDAVFDLVDRRFYSSGGPAARANRIEVYLNDPPLQWAFEKLGDSYTIPAAAHVRFWVKQAVSDDDYLVFGERTLTVDRGQFHLGEDWTSADLVALFAGGKKYVDLIAQLEVNLPGDPADQYRKGQISLRLWNDVAGGAAVGTAPSTFRQTKPYSALTGGAAAALDSVVTVNLAVDTWTAQVIITTGGVPRLSIWLLTAGDDVEDIEAGIVRPDDYAGGTNEKVWKKVAG